MSWVMRPMLFKIFITWTRFWYLTKNTDHASISTFYVYHHFRTRFGCRFWACEIWLHVWWWVGNLTWILLSCPHSGVWQWGSCRKIQETQHCGMSGHVQASAIWGHFAISCQRCSLYTTTRCRKGDQEALCVRCATLSISTNQRIAPLWISWTPSKGLSHFDLSSFNITPAGCRIPATSKSWITVGQFYRSKL